MITRRHFILRAGVAAGAGLALPAYAAGIEPMIRLGVTSYEISPASWPVGHDLTIAVIADIHATDPWMSLERIEAVVALTNAQVPDLVVLAGDYVRSTYRGLGRSIPMRDVAAVLSGLRAPLGVHAVLGNHDMWLNGGEDVRDAFARHGLPILDNHAVRIDHEGRGFWLLGLADQIAYRDWAADTGLDDLPGTLAQLTTSEPAILIAHEPDIFPSVPERIALTISGHTHGGQVRVPLLGSLVVPSRYGRRYDYGHIIEDGRHLVVSGGLGVSGMPLRFNMPPEIVMIRLGLPAGRVT